MLLLVGSLDILLVVEFFYFRSQEGDKTKNINSAVLLSILSIFSVLGILLYVLLGGVFRTGEPLLSWSGLNRLISTFAIGFGEELLFRGLLQFRFVEWMGEKKGIITTSILFTLMHIPMAIVSFEIFQGNLTALSFFMFYLFCSGIFLGFLVNRTKNISGAVILHAVSDLL